MRPTPTILTVGAAGPFAGLVVPALARRGARVRALVRHSEQGEAVRAHGAAEVAVGDLTDRVSLDAALRGVEAVFYLAPAFLPNEAEVGRGMVEAARRAGVRRFVFSSVIYPSLSALVNHAAKAPVEEAILSSGMEFTFLQPSLFFQNYAHGWPEVVKTGVHAEPWSTETRFSRVDYRDVAEVAAVALLEDRLIFGTYELCAAGNFHRRDVAALMGEVLGRKVEAVRHRSDAVAGGKRPGDPGEDEPITPLERMFDWYDAYGLPGNPLVLRAVLGREPRTLRAYFEELARGEGSFVVPDAS